MENLKIALRTLTRGNGNIIKIACLGVGLLMGLLLVAKVVFELSYDNFYADAGRVFTVRSNIAVGDGGTQSFFQTAGSVAPGIMSEVAGVEAATRMMDRGVSWIETDGGEKWEGTNILSDRELFNVLPRPIVAGAGSEALAVPTNMLVSRSLADKIGPDPVGMTVWLNGDRETAYTIAGVYEDLPDNTRQPGYDIVTSLEQIGFANSWYAGNSTFSSYVHLAPGVDPEGLTPAIRRMQENHQDVAADRAKGSNLHYSLYPLRKIHSDAPDTRRNVLILSILAAVVLVAAVMNYVLVDIASVAGRAKGVATRRCYGAQARNVVSMVFTESLLHVALSLGLAAALAAVLSDFIGYSLQVPLSSLLGLPAVLAVLAGICLTVLAVAVAVPANMLVNVPIAAVFRAFRRSGRAWKLSMLAGQFAVSAFIVIFLMSVQRQYSMMENTDPGYDYRELVRISVHRLNTAERIRLVEELGRMPQVSKVAVTDGLPYNMSGLGGNNVSLPGVDERINIFDFGSASVNYPSVMGIRMIEGAGFTDQSADRSSVISRSLADRIEALTGWESVVGRTVNVDIHGESTVVGVYDNLLVGDMNRMDDRPSAMFLFTDPENPGDFGVREVIVKLNGFTDENIAAVRAALPGIVPEKELEAALMRDDLHRKYETTRMFRNSVTAACLIILAIAMAGLVGFVYNETNRRAAEIAIRKIHGATSKGILRMLGLDVGRIALVALIPGAVGAYFAAGRWMQNFARQASRPFALLAVGGLVLLAVIVAFTLLNTIRIARRNPVESLKTD